MSSMTDRRLNGWRRRCGPRGASPAPPRLRRLQQTQSATTWEKARPPRAHRLPLRGAGHPRPHDRDVRHRRRPVHRGRGPSGDRGRPPRIDRARRPSRKCVRPSNCCLRAGVRPAFRPTRPARGDAHRTDDLQRRRGRVRDRTNPSAAPRRPRDQRPRRGHRDARDARLRKRSPLAARASPDARDRPLRLPVLDPRRPTDRSHRHGDLGLARRVRVRPRRGGPRPSSGSAGCPSTARTPQGGPAISRATGGSSPTGAPSVSSRSRSPGLPARSATSSTRPSSSTRRSGCRRTSPACRISSSDWSGWRQPDSAARSCTSSGRGAR